ncbi:MAG: DNA polymerase I [Thermodesulfobacteriota bacterium]|nr:DNA polymerase I [Thermodesulfobacteriota bacterium]
MTEKTSKPTLFLIDGTNYIYRAFYAIRGLSNSRGFPTNAIYGFTNMLMKLCHDWEPDYIAVVFDAKGPTFRHEAYDQYKANRKAMPDELRPQIPHIKDIVRGFSIKVIEEQGVEADDVIGTLAKRCEQAGMKVVIASGDKDLMQLVSEKVLMVDTMKDISYDVEGVRKRFGVEPDRVIDILGLAGDTSDNVPGVPGVGEKTALKLVKEFGSLEDVLENAGKIKGRGLSEKLKEFADQARMSRDLVTIRTDVPIDSDLEDFRSGEPDVGTLKGIFWEFEFPALISRLGIKDEKEETDYRLITGEVEFNNLLDEVRQSDRFSFDLELTSDEAMRAEITGVAVCTDEKRACYIPLSHTCEEAQEQLDADMVLERLALLFSDDNLKKYGHNLKTASLVLSRRGIALKGALYDVMVASYILNPSRRGYDLSDIVQDHLGRRIASPKDLMGSGAKAIPFHAVPLKDAAEYACCRADFIFRLAPFLDENMEKTGLKDLFRDVEMPLVGVLALMEERGVLLDCEFLGEMSLQLGELLNISEEKVYRLAGEEFNINSPKQLQTILFDRLGLPRGKKTKAGYSTDVDVLTNLAKSYELPAEILAYRSLAKLRSTYVDALPALVNPETGRVHTSYNQTVTATGRLSSSNPNLQNIPIRTPEGKRIRQAFIASEGCEIVSADYSQIELRILAHLSGDKLLIEAFESGEDVHTKTASDIFGVFPGMVSEEMRRQAKVINFGVIYGMSPFGLARELGISQKKAKDYIDGYFSRFFGVRRFIEETLEKARERGFVTTLLNRRRYIPELNSGNVQVRQFAERMAVNTPIQGTASDLIKVAMLNIAAGIKAKELSAFMIMQVHDELVFEVPIQEKEEIMNLVRWEMENVIALKIPIEVKIASGKNWDEAH